MPPLPLGRARIFPDHYRSSSRIEVAKWSSPFPNAEDASRVSFSCSSITVPAKSLRRGGVLKTGLDKRLFSFGSPEVSNDDPGNLSIEGNKTGEEVLVEQTAPRQKRDSPCEDLPSLKRKLAQARGEVRELTSKLRKTKSDSDRNRALSSCILKEMTVRKDEQLKFFTDREDVVRESIKTPLVLSTENVKALQELQEKALKLQRELDARTTAFDAEKLSWVAKVEEEGEKVTSEALEKIKGRVWELEELVDSERSRFSFEKQVLVGEKSAVELLLQQSYEKIRNLEMLQAEEEFIVVQARQFVKNVCKPGFAVVKDSSLEPVEKNREYPTGYVLVPLIVLLHGYSLLPDNDREKVIQEYEDRATWLKS